jgi:Type II secretion system (T2SS), protein G
MRWKLLAFLVGGVFGFLLSQAAQSMIDAGAASKMKRSIGDAIVFSAALEMYRSDNGHYPPVLSGDHLAQSLSPKYLRAVPTDVYGRPYLVAMNGTTAAVISLGRGGFVVQKQKLIECHPYTTEGCW